MALVKKLRLKKGDEAPLEHLESAGEILIKQLVKKQTNTSITLEDQLKNEQKFEQGVGFVSLDQIGSGSITLKEFEKKKKQVESVCELKIKGLNQQEAFSLVTSNGSSKANPEVKNALQQYLTPQLQSESEKPGNQNVLFGKRQERELALSIKPDSVETRLYKFALSNESNEMDFRPPDHPIHQLAAMEKSLLISADPIVTAKTIRRKWRQQMEAISEPASVHFKPPVPGYSLWDSIEPPVTISKKPKICEKPITCSKEMLYTVREGEILKLDTNCTQQKPKVNSTKPQPRGYHFVSIQEPDGCPLKISGKLCEEDIKQLSQFKNYDRGKESKVLYIKNLASNLTESELAALFSPFQEPADGNIVFRLLSGKMRGQAFITYKTCANSRAALEAMNGSIFKGRPIIVHYGKQQE